MFYFKETCIGSGDNGVDERKLVLPCHALSVKIWKRARQTSTQVYGYKSI